VAALLSPSPLSLRFEASYLQPAPTDVAKGIGAGLGASYRLTDQIAVIASASENVVWTRAGQPAGAPRVSRSVFTVGGGALAVLDATPVAPFLEATLVGLAPQEIAGYSLAGSIAVGADWAFVRAWAVGIAVRSLTPLDSPGGITAASGIAIATRLVWTPAF